MLYLKTFGGLSVETDSAPVTGAAQQRKRLALLALLAAAGRRGTSRDKIIAYLWPDSDAEHGRNLLKQACFALRRDLHAPELLLGTLELRLNPEIIATDVQRFEDALESGDRAQAVAVYSGPFLDGFYLNDAGEFERWVEEERAQWRKRVCEALESLAVQAKATGDVRGAVRWWRRLTELDRLSSHAALGLLRALVAAGDRVAALEFGRVHTGVLREVLGTRPDAAVTELLERLRAAGTGAAASQPALAVLPPESAPVPVPSRSTRISQTLKRVAVGAAAVAAVVVAVVASSLRPARLDSELLVVAPFEILDRKLQKLNEPLLNGLSRNLDGFGPFRTVPPSGVGSGGEPQYDRAAATALGRRTGAGIVLFGQLTSVRPDSVRLRVGILDVATDGIVAEIDRTGPADAPDRLADSLSLDVIRARAPAAGIPLRLLSVGARSLPALKAFIQGERYFRRFALDSAVSSYERAIGLDTTFAVAIRAAGVARSWNFQDGGAYLVRAGVLNHGLSGRDSLAVASDAQGVFSDPAAFHHAVAGRFAILNEAVRRYPDDAELWFQLGDLRFHNGFEVWWNTWSDARAAFDRAIALDSSLAVAYVHAVEIALNDADTAAARRYVRGYLAIPSVNAGGAAMRLLDRLLDTNTDTDVIDRELLTARLPALRRLAFAVRTWPDAREHQVRVARHLVARATPGTSPAADYDLRQYQSLLAQALIFRGHLREAREVVGDRFVMSPFMELAHLGAIPPETVETAIARWLKFPQHPDYAGDHVAFPWLMEAPCYRTMEVAWWWATRRDTVQLRRLLHREDSTTRVVRVASLAQWARPVPRFVRSALALARGDTAAALGPLWFAPDSLCPDARPHARALFRVLAAQRRDRDAETVFDWRHDRWVPWVFERARLAERRHDRATAIKFYRFVADAWHNADPELHSIVGEARSALERLGPRQ